MQQNLKLPQMGFPTDSQRIQERIELIDPLSYAKTRNYTDGFVTRLSPYLSRGVITTKDVLDSLLNRFSISECYKIVQELAWREYFQEIWKVKGELINQDLRYPQQQVKHHKIPHVILNAQTGIQVIDNGIQDLKNTGYMHNHIRMYTAMLTCNIGKYAWYKPAQWMYYYLIDGDWASNALSWQWVSGSNSIQKYYANQENINMFSKTEQAGTIVDLTYEELREIKEVPSLLNLTEDISLKTNLPAPMPIEINPDLPTYMYNWYNLDPKWDKEIKANRILFLEPTIFELYPISDKSVQFMLNLAQNIQDIQIFVGSFIEFNSIIKDSKVHFKEHPLNSHYQGTAHKRDRIFSIEGYYPSFSKFWKLCNKELKNKFYAD